MAYKLLTSQKLNNSFRETLYYIGSFFFALKNYQRESIQMLLRRERKMFNPIIAITKTESMRPIKVFTEI